MLYSASPTKPVEISDCKLVGNKATIEGDFATKNDLIKNNLMLLPKAEKSYNPVNGALENTSVRFGTGLVKVNEGLVLKTEGVDKPYIVYFDDTLKYTGYRRPHVEPEYNGVFDIPAGTSYIAITSNTDFVACYITKIDVNGQHIFPVEYKDEDFQPYSQVPRLLRKNGVMVSYTLPSGENVIEVFKDPGNIDLTSNHFGVQQHWKRLAYTDIVDGIHQHPMKGKTFYSIGDSHRWKWNELLANLTGSVAGGDLLIKAKINRF